MELTVTQETFKSLGSCGNDPSHCLSWNSVFSLPDWLEVWWREFKPSAELYLGAVRREGAVIGLAPLKINGAEASFIGDVDVCDYLDFVIAEGETEPFFKALLDDLKGRGVESLDLHALRPDSTVLTGVSDVAVACGCRVSCQAEDVSVEMDLPSSFDEYLETLNSKQRHEVRRKLRRLTEAGDVQYSVVSGEKEVTAAMNTFLTMFTESRSDKADFLTDRMESFFRHLAETFSGDGLLKMGRLELDGQPAAMILYFDYKDTIYLYNSGYNPGSESLSVGLLSKVLCIRDSIEKGRKRFDFLKGNEVYKYRLGGKEIPLSNCRITLKQ